MPDQERVAEWYLKPVSTRGGHERIPLLGDVTFGRADSNTVTLSEANYPHVSGHHARIVAEADGALRLEDLGSRNGTLVNESPIQSVALQDGDVVRLGQGGPLFVVEARDGARLTEVLPPEVLKAHRPPMTQSTIVRMKRALGIPDHTDVGDLMADSDRRSRRRVRIAAVVGVVGVIAAVVIVRSLQQEELDVLAASNTELQQRLSNVSSSFQTQLAAWEEQKQRLEQERASLQQRLQEAAQGPQAEIAGLRQALDDTNERLQRYDPVVVERTRQEGIGRVQRAVVYVETKIRLRSSKTKKLLRVHEARMTFDDVGQLFERESSGSGFCIDENGLVVTNAHVVQPEGFDAELPIGPDDKLRPELDLAVVFSGDDKRHPARIVKSIFDGDDDLALLVIEPFEGMPVIEGFATDAAAPSPGAEVYLHGFPLGKMAMQEGQRVIASSFRGILSRTVSNWLQVDAAVHPGNSGGPLTDATGRVIGVVTRVQRIDRDAIAPDMGYAIPVAAVTQLLAEEPPKKSK